MFRFAVVCLYLQITFTLPYQEEDGPGWRTAGICVDGQNLEGSIRENSEALVYEAIDSGQSGLQDVSTFLGWWAEDVRAGGG